MTFPVGTSHTRTAASRRWRSAVTTDLPLGVKNTSWALPSKPPNRSSIVPAATSIIRSRLPVRVVPTRSVLGKSLPGSSSGHTRNRPSGLRARLCCPRTLTLRWCSPVFASQTCASPASPRLTTRFPSAVTAS